MVDYSKPSPWLEIEPQHGRRGLRLDRLSEDRVAIAFKDHRGEPWRVLSVGRLTRRGRLRARGVGRSERVFIEEIVHQQRPQAAARAERLALREEAGWEAAVASRRRAGTRGDDDG